MNSFILQMEERCSPDDDFCEELMRLTNGFDNDSDNSDDPDSNGSCYVNMFGRSRPFYPPIVDPGYTDWDVSPAINRPDPLVPKGRGRTFPNVLKSTNDVTRQCQEIFGNGPREVSVVSPIKPQLSYVYVSVPSVATKLAPEQFEDFESYQRNSSLNSSHVESNGFSSVCRVRDRHLDELGSSLRRISTNQIHDEELSQSNSIASTRLDNHEFMTATNGRVACERDGNVADNNYLFRSEGTGGERGFNNFVSNATVGRPAGYELEDESEVNDIYHSSDEEPQHEESFQYRRIESRSRQSPIVSPKPNAGESLITEILSDSTDIRPFVRVEKRKSSRGKLQPFCGGRAPPFPRFSEKKRSGLDKKFPVVSNFSSIRPCVSKFLDLNENSSSVYDEPIVKRETSFGGIVEGPETWTQDDDFPTMASSSRTSSAKISPTSSVKSFSKFGNDASDCSGGAGTSESYRRTGAAKSFHEKLPAPKKLPSTAVKTEVSAVKAPVSQVTSSGLVVRAPVSPVISSGPPVKAPVSAVISAYAENAQKSNSATCDASHDSGAIAENASDKPPTMVLLENLPKTICVGVIRDFLETFGKIFTIRLDANCSNGKVNAVVGVDCESTCEYLISCLDGCQVPFEGSDDEGVLAVTKIL